MHVKSVVDDVSTHGAALTYAAFLSLVPLILLGLAVTGQGRLAARAPDATLVHPELVNAIPGLGAVGREPAGRRLPRSATSLGLIGLVGVLWTASVADEPRATARLSVIVFGAPRRTVANRFRALVVDGRPRDRR